MNKRESLEKFVVDMNRKREERRLGLFLKDLMEEIYCRCKGIEIIDLNELHEYDSATYCAELMDDCKFTVQRQRSPEQRSACINVYHANNEYKINVVLDNPYNGPAFTAVYNTSDMLNFNSFEFVGNDDCDLELNIRAAIVRYAKYYYNLPLSCKYILKAGDKLVKISKK